MKIIKKVLKIVIILLIILSLFYTFYEYDNYKRAYSSTIYMYKEGLYYNSTTTKEFYMSDLLSQERLIMVFKQLLIINVAIVGLVIIYCRIVRISSSQNK